MFASFFNVFKCPFTDTILPSLFTLVNSPTWKKPLTFRKMRAMLVGKSKHEEKIDMARKVVLKVAEVAQARGITQAQLQRAVQCNPSTVRSYWHNHSSMVSLDMLQRFADVLHCPIADLLETVEE